jgi:hypothetical protein
MAPKKSSSASAGGTSIGKALGRGAKSAALGNPLAGKKAGAVVTSAQSTKPQESTLVKPAYTKEQLAIAEGRQDLDPNDPSYNALWESVKQKIGMPKNAPSKFMSTSGD